MACVEEVAETVSGVGLSFSLEYRLSACFCASVMLLRMTAAWMGFTAATWANLGRLEARELNWVVHCTVGVVLRKPVAGRVAGAPIDRSAMRDAPFRSMVIMRV